MKLTIIFFSAIMKRSFAQISKHCKRCLQSNHDFEECPYPHEIVNCEGCIRLNVLSPECNCNDYTRPPPPQVLRMCGKKQSPKWYIDLNINNRRFVALLNPTLDRGTVSKAFALWLQSQGNDGTELKEGSIKVNIKRNGRMLQITCDILHEQVVHIQIGGDFMKYLKYKFTMEGITLDSEHSYVASSPYDLNYGYNIPKIGEDLRDYLKTKAFFLKKARTIKEQYGIPATSSPPRQVIRISRSKSVASTSSCSTEYQDEQSITRKC